MDSDGAAAKLRGDCAAAARGTVAAALAFKLAVVVSVVVVGRQAATRNTSRRRCPRTRTPRIPGTRRRRLGWSARRAGEPSPRPARRQDAPASARSDGCLKQSFTAATLRASDGGAGRRLIGSKRARQRRRQPASTAALTWWRWAVAAGTRRRSGVATGQRRRAWSRRAGSGVDGISFTVHPLSDQAHTAQILNQCSLTWSFSSLQAWIVRRRCSRAPTVLK